ncbi:MAG: hypothetical protein WKG01_42155 [Kofleriaceae bacterium]
MSNSIAAGSERIWKQTCRECRNTVYLVKIGDKLVATEPDRDRGRRWRSTARINARRLHVETAQRSSSEKREWKAAQKKVARSSKRAPGLDRCHAQEQVAHDSALRAENKKLRAGSGLQLQATSNATAHRAQGSPPPADALEANTALGHMLARTMRRPAGRSARRIAAKNSTIATSAGSSPSSSIWDDRFVEPTAPGSARHERC